MLNSKTAATNETTINQADIRRVLKNWHDSNKLGQDALATLGVVKQQQLKEGYGDTYEGCAQALRSILQNVIGEFKTIARGEDLHDDQWIYFVILTEQYINRRKSDAVYDELAISKRAYFNKQKEALKAVAAKVEELQAQNRATLTITAPPEPVSPPDVKNFIGRANELAYFQKKLDQLNYVVIVGFPGTGKTLLAAKLIRETSDPARLFWYKCRSGDTVDSLLWALAGFLVSCGQDKLWRNLHAAREQARQDAIPVNMRINYAKDLLSQQPYAICFDDLQLIADTPDVFSFVKQLHELTQTSQLRLIITSHAIPSFVRQRFEPLIGLTLEDTKLLVATRGISLEPTQIADLHKLTEGQPVFLNLALDILAETGDTERLLQHLPQEENIEQYLLQSVDQQLTHDERVLMSGIAVLGDQTSGRDVIETVVDGGRISRSLRNLSMRNLLAVSLGPNGREYSQHSIVRAFYYEELGIRERHAMHQRAGEYYAAQEEGLKAAGHFADTGNDIQAAELATQNVRSWLYRGEVGALQQLLERFRLETLGPLHWTRVQLALGHVYTFLDEHQPAQTSFEAALTQLDLLNDADSHQALKVEAYRGLAHLLRSRQPADALVWVEAGLAEVSGRDPLLEADLLIQKGVALRKIKKNDGSLLALEKSLELLPALSDPQTSSVIERLRLLALLNLGNHYFYQSELTLARDYLQQALTVAEALDDPVNLLAVRINLATLQHLNGEWVAARQAYEAALTVAEKLGNRREEVRLGFNLGLLTLQMGDDEQALTIVTSMLDLARQIGFNESRVGGLAYLAELHLLRGELETAKATLKEAELLSTKTQIEYQLPLIYRLMAQYHLAIGEPADAANDAQRALDSAEQLDMGQEAGPAWRTLAEAQLATGQTQQALANLEESLNSLDEDPYEAARTQVVWGRYLLECGEAEVGQERLSAAQTTFQKLHATRDLAEVAMLLSTM